MGNILIVSNGTAVSGAEYVLEDYLRRTAKRFDACIPDVPEIRAFFQNLPNIERIDCFSTWYTAGKYKTFSRLRNALVAVRQAVELDRLLRKRKYDLIYVSNSGSCLPAGLVHRLRPDRRMALHLHDMMSGSPFRLPIRLLCRDLDAIAVSEACRRELIEQAGFRPERVALLYNGIDTDRFSADPEPAPPREADRLRIGFAGGLIERKGALTLARAFAGLSIKYPGLSLEMACNLEDPDYGRRVRDALAGTRSSIQSCGREEMPAFYRGIDLLVVPSRRDPLPTAALEGMAAGAVVLGSRVDGLRELLPERCLFRPDDAEDLTRLLEQVLRDFASIRRQCRAENAEAIRQKFSMEKKNAAMDAYFDRMTAHASSFRG